MWRLARPDKALYDLTLATQPLEAFVPMYRYHRTSPESHFARSLICTVPTPEGRITLINNKLIRKENGKRQVRIIQSEGQRDQVLEKYFHMDMIYLV